MTTTTHTAIGIVIGSLIGEPILGFALGVSSHFLVDMIPHGDMFMRQANNLLTHEQKKLSTLFAFTDVALGIALLVMVGAILPNEITQSPVYIASIFGSVLPDLLVGLNDLKKTTLGKKYVKLHFFFHDMLCRRYGDTRLPYALLGQAAFVACIIYWLT